MQQATQALPVTVCDNCAMQAVTPGTVAAGNSYCNYCWAGGNGGITPVPHYAYTGPHYSAANNLLVACQALYGWHRAGKMAPRTVHQQASAHMQAANNLMVTAYAAGRGYAATARVCQQAYNLANQMATATNAA